MKSVADWVGPVRRAAVDLLDLFYPASCVVCACALADDEAYTQRGGAICSECRAAMTAAESVCCPFCAGSAYYTESDRGRCRRCRNHRFGFSQVIALGPYVDPLRATILRMKRDTSGRIAGAFADWMIRERWDALQNFRADGVIAVPSHFLRRSMRGADPASLLAEVLAKRLGLPFYRAAMRRIRATRRQGILLRDARRKNVAGAFAMRPNSEKKLAGKRLLLVDDILTTGATANEVTQVLLAQQVSTVAVVVVARAEGKRATPVRRAG